MDFEQNQEVMDHAPEPQEEQEKEAGDGHKLELDSPVDTSEAEKSPVNGQGAETEVEYSPKKICESPQKVQEAAEVVFIAETSPEKKPVPEYTAEQASEPVNIQNPVPEQQPMAVKTPELLPLDDPVAEDNVETMPTKVADPVPEAVELSEQAESGLATQLESPLEQEEKKPEGPVKLSESEIVLEEIPKVQAEPQTVKVEPRIPVTALIPKEIEQEKPVEAAIVKTMEAEKPVEVETVKTVEAEKPVEVETVKTVEAEKPVEVETVKTVEAEKPVEVETVKTVEAEKQADTVEQPKPEIMVAPEIMEEVETKKCAEGDAEDVKQKADVKLEEQVPIPGTMSFAIMDHEQTKATLRSSRTLIVLRGLPGSGKTLLARAIANSYPDLCTVFSADDHGIKLDSPDPSAEAYKALDDAVVACCTAGTSAQVIVVDDTNHNHERLARFAEVAEENRLVAMFLEPRTEWVRDLPQLAQKSQRGLEEAQIQAMKVLLEETSLPLFFGWFLLPGIQDKVRCTSMDFIKTLDTLEAFKKHLTDFTGEAEKEVDLEQYFSAIGALHCTTKFCDYGKAEGAKEYAEKPAVKELYGSAFELSLSALFVTPRTVGARVSLTEDQMTLWPADAEKEAESAVPAAATLPAGSRAHVSLGCAEGVEPVQTGIDLLEILALQQEGQGGELVEEMELGSLAYYGKGRWLLSLREPISAQACFSSHYGPKKADPKKDGEKKKKQKCTIL
ncbi:hypothetical protein UPYG_G00098140 [Umbra pygmaea]|uniref:2',3'-cyclic-nucleotide 3'-phosphodiesterase n=1 Tax=Umbra pygmaea TaxID=75934 RepID=A0ABD0X0P4_UMBPY